MGHNVGGAGAGAEARSSRILGVQKVSTGGRPAYALLSLLNHLDLRLACSRPPPFASVGQSSHKFQMSLTRLNKTCVFRSSCLKNGFRGMKAALRICAAVMGLKDEEQHALADWTPGPATMVRARMKMDVCHLAMRRREWHDAKAPDRLQDKFIQLSGLAWAIVQQPVTSLCFVMVFLTASPSQVLTPANERRNTFFWKSM